MTENQKSSNEAKDAEQPANNEESAQELDEESLDKVSGGTTGVGAERQHNKAAVHIMTTKHDTVKN